MHKLGIKSIFINETRPYLHWSTNVPEIHQKGTKVLYTFATHGLAFLLHHFPDMLTTYNLIATYLLCQFLLLVILGLPSTELLLLCYVTTT